MHENDLIYKLFIYAQGNNVLISVIILMMLIIALVFGYFLLNYLSKERFNMIFKRQKPMPKIDRSPMEIDQSLSSGRARNWFYTHRQEFINVKIRSYDETKLAGYYRRSADFNCKNTVICLHDYGEHPDSMAPYAKVLMRQMECNVLFIHQRAHHMSGGRYCTYGVYETEDLNFWIRFILKRTGVDSKIYLMGHGMGATTALIAAAQKNFSYNVVGIIADSPYDTLKNYLFDSRKGDFLTNNSLMKYKIASEVRKVLKFDMGVCDAAVGAGKIKVPVLIFVGGMDEDTPMEMGNRIYDSLLCPKRMVILEKASHRNIYDYAPENYSKEISKFVEKCAVILIKQGRM